MAIIVPDHWHAIMTVDGGQGRQGHLLRKAALADHPARAGDGQGGAASTSGSCRPEAMWRSDDAARRACELVRNGRIGQVKRILTDVAANNAKSPGPGWKPMPVPEGFDYETWLGPAPAAPYHQDRCLYRFRFILDYSGGQTTNFGCHAQRPGPMGHWAPTTAGRSSSRTWARSCRRRAACSPRPRRSNFRARYANGVELICRTTQAGFGVRFEGTEGWVEFTARACGPARVAQGLEDRPQRNPLAGEQSDRQKRRKRSIRTITWAISSTA